MFNIGIYVPDFLPFSIKNYVENITSRLPENINIYKASSLKELSRIRKKVSVFWFPNCAGGSAPDIRVMNLLKENNIIITLHGAAPFSVPPNVYYSSIKATFKGEVRKYLDFIKWQIYKRRSNIRKFITVSKYAKTELASKLKIPKEKIIFIYHGVDFKTFNFYDSKLGNGNYLLHISQYQPKKNLDRIIEAYKLLGEPKPKLILIVPGYNKKATDRKIKIINSAKKPEELSYYYKNALAFIFPSLHETFGMPILEAMACGCPVITSNVSACPEVVGNAALLVNPYSVDQLAEAMQKLIVDSRLRKELSKKGIERSKQFTWEKSAKEHLKVFEEVLKEG